MVSSAVKAPHELAKKERKGVISTFRWAVIASINDNTPWTHLVVQLEARHGLGEDEFLRLLVVRDSVDLVLDRITKGLAHRSSRHNRSPTKLVA